MLFLRFALFPAVICSLLCIAPFTGIKEPTGIQQLFQYRVLA
jgi:hypothetical protein